MRKLLLITLLLPSLLFAQKNKSPQPKLVVGIVVDQMRYDYLFRYWNKYSEGGFKRLVNEGFSFKNANYNYVPTYTAPGHACIYTGTTPSVNGIISNDWYDRNLKKSVYCVSDSLVKPVGTTSISGKMSPRNLLSTTMTDELRLATNFNAKVIGVALKDRGAILPAGRTANAAYWHDPFSDNWISSTFYLSELPQWVKDFNGEKLGAFYTSTPWTTLLPIDQYTESTADDNAYEGLFRGELKPVFPHDIPAYKGTENEIIRRTPFGNTFTKDFAVAALKGENMGKGSATDFLAISFSSTDYVGHSYGLNAIETEDTYLRLDRDLAELLKVLDEWIGGEYLLFFTADHGAVHNPQYSKDKKIEAGFFEEKLMIDSLKKFLTANYGSAQMLLNASSDNIFFDRNFLDQNKISLQDIQQKTADFLTKLPSVAVTMTGYELSKGLQRTGVYSLMQNGFNQKRSSDVMIALNPGWIDAYALTGTTHGAAYSYDTHVPVIFFGKGIVSGSSVDPVFVTDIAPTICSLLNIEFPSGNSGRPLLK
jgi:predicted AlkP superfamily pyrophosphatase or phosphodiesterase